MRTTLDIDASLMKAALEASGAPTKTAAVHMGLQALVDRAARKRLAALHGKLPHIQAPPRRRPPESESR